MNKSKLKKRILYVILLLLILGFAWYFRDDLVKLLSGAVYLITFGVLSLFSSKEDKETKKNYVEAMKENDEAIKDAVKLAEDIQKSKIDHLKEMEESVKKAKEKVDNMSDSELVDWGNKFITSKSGN